MAQNYVTPWSFVRTSANLSENGDMRQEFECACLDHDELVVAVFCLNVPKYAAFQRAASSIKEGAARRLGVASIDLYRQSGAKLLHDQTFTLDPSLYRITPSGDRTARPGEPPSSRGPVDFPLTDHLDSLVFDPQTRYDRFEAIERGWPLQVLNSDTVYTAKSRIKWCREVLWLTRITESSRHSMYGLMEMVVRGAWDLKHQTSDGMVLRVDSRRKAEVYASFNADLNSWHAEVIPRDKKKVTWNDVWTVSAQPLAADRLNESWLELKNKILARILTPSEHLLMQIED